MSLKDKVVKMTGALARREASESAEDKSKREDNEEIRKAEDAEANASSRSDLTDIIGNLFEAHNAPIHSALEHLTDAQVLLGSKVQRVIDSERNNTRVIAGMMAKLEHLVTEMREIRASIGILSQDVSRVKVDSADTKDRVTAIEQAQAQQWRQIGTLFRDTPNATGDGDGDDKARREAIDGDQTPQHSSTRPAAKKDPPEPA